MRLSFDCLEAAPLDVAHFRRTVWPKATFHRSLGRRPRNSERLNFVGRRPSLSSASRNVIMAFGQISHSYPPSWGVAPGYGDEWPSAKCGSAKSVRIHGSKATGLMGSASNSVCRANVSLLTAGGIPATSSSRSPERGCCGASGPRSGERGHDEKPCFHLKKLLNGVADSG